MLRPSASSPVKKQLSANIQREGEIDLLIRCMENESAERLARSKDDFSLSFHYQNIISISWIGGVYEIFRLLRERHLNDSGDVFQSILSDLELLRIPLEKHEIAKDRTISSPLQMIKYPQKGGPSDFYTYDHYGNHKQGHALISDRSPWVNTPHQALALSLALCHFCFYYSPIHIEITNTSEVSILPIAFANSSRSLLFSL
jgi:hypothetical protein